MKNPVKFGKYYLLDRINVGGMAEVFRAKVFGEAGFERPIAVKRILPSIAEDQEFISMFIDEAKLAVQLTHPNIAQIFELGKVGEAYFIALEYVAGRDLRAMFDRARKRGEALPIPLACYVVMKICEGLDYAHNKKDASGRSLDLVHRDVSPQNMLISWDGDVKLIDFGIAKAASKSSRTQAGILKGKFGYMSPEQVRGLQVDRRSDVFAVGICLYELLTMERLFVGESDFSTLEKVRNVEVLRPSTLNRKIPEELETIVLKSLAKHPEDRYRSAMDLHDDLQSFMYTSGNFFARKDLSAFMQRAFAEDIAKEAAREEEFRKFDARKATDLGVFDNVAAPPTASGGGPARGAPPAPPVAAKRVSVPPPPPPAARVSVPPPPPPAAGARVPKSTMMGVAPPPSAPAARAPAPAPAPVPAPGAKTDFDWDDDEMSTQVYDRSRPGAPPPPSAAPPDPPAPASMAQPEPAHLRSRVPTAQMPAVGAPMPRGLPAVPAPGPAALPPTAQQPMYPPPPTLGASAGPYPGPAPAPPGVPMGYPQPPYGTPAGQTAQFPPQGYPQPAAPQQGMHPGMPFPGELTPGSAPGYAPPQGPARSRTMLVGAAVGVVALAAVATLVVMKFATPSTGTLTVTANVPGVTLVVDNQPQPGNGAHFTISGLSPETPHRVVARRDGFRAFQQDVPVRSGQTTAIEITLEPEPSGSVAMVAPTAPTAPAVGVPVPSAPAPVAPAVPQPVAPAAPAPVAPTPIAVALPAPAPTLVRQTSTPRHSSSTPRQTARVLAPPPPPPPPPPSSGGSGMLSISTRPASQCTVAGQTFSTPRLRLSLPAGTHRVSCRNSDFNVSGNFTVTIRAGQETREINHPLN